VAERSVALPRGQRRDETLRVLDIAAVRIGARLESADAAHPGPPRAARIRTSRGAIDVHIDAARLRLSWADDDRWARMMGPVTVRTLDELLGDA
jgi:hypothetical protein